jgi:hypothetical protein
MYRERVVLAHLAKVALDSRCIVHQRVEASIMQRIALFIRQIRGGSPFARCGTLFCCWAAQAITNADVQHGPVSTASAHWGGTDRRFDSVRVSRHSGVRHIEHLYEEGIVSECVSLAVALQLLALRLGYSWFLVI